MRLRALTLACAVLLGSASCGSGELTYPERVYVSDDSHAILFDTEKETSLILTSSSDYVFTVLQESSTREWVIAERAPAITGPGRVETEHLLFNVPRRLLIDVSGYDSELTSYGIAFEIIDGEEFVVAMKGSTWEEVQILPGELLEIDGKYIIEALKAGGEGETATGRRAGDEDRYQVGTDTRSGERVVPSMAGVPAGPCEALFELVIELGEDDEQIGQGVTEKWLEMGRLIYAVPSFAVHDGRLYLVDAINFRVMVYDIAAGGELLYDLYYPDTNQAGNMMVIRDIAVHDDFIYLLSVYDYAVHVIDTGTGSVIAVIDGSGTPAGRFGDLRSVNLDHHRNLIIFDAYDNSLYTYRRDGTGFEISVDDGALFDVYESLDNVDNAVVIGTGANGNKFLRVVENSMSQFGGQVMLYVIDAAGEIIRICETAGWSGGGPMQRSLVVSLDGEVWEALFDGDHDDPDKPPASIAVRRIF